MRNSISIFGQTNNDLLLGVEVIVKEAGVVVASTAPVGSETLIHDNNDGTYYFDVAETFKGTVYVGSNETAQDEMAETLFYGDDILDHLSDSGAHLSVSEESKVNNLPDNTAGDIVSINNSLALKATSADLTNLTTTVNGKASSTAGTGMVSETGSKLAPNLHADYLEVDSNGKIVVKQQFSNEEVLSSSKNLVQNLERLQQRIQQVSGATTSSNVNSRMIYQDTAINTSGANTPIMYEVETSGNGEYEICRVLYLKFVDDNSIDIYITSISDTEDYTIKAYLFPLTASMIESDEINIIEGALEYQGNILSLNTSSCVNGVQYRVILSITANNNSAIITAHDVMMVAKT